MSFTLDDAERLLRERLGEPINRVTRGHRIGLDNLKVLGFAAGGRVLALNRQATTVARLWIEPLDPPRLAGVRSTIGEAPKNADLTGKLSVLRPPNGRQLEFISEEGLRAFLDWYSGRETDNATGSVDTESGPASTFERRYTTTGDDALRAAIQEMCDTVRSTVLNSNGQAIERVVKNKELRIPDGESLEDLLASLLEATGSRCALSNLPLQFSGPDLELRPSVDRIDSNGHYEKGNIQIVCRFVNRWKNDGDNAEFKRLLTLIQDEWRPKNMLMEPMSVTSPENGRVTLKREATHG